MLPNMLGRIPAFLGLTERARLGALGLHLAAGLIVLSVHIHPIAQDDLKILSIELVEARSIEPEVATVEPLPELPRDNPEPDVDLEVVAPQPQPQPEIEPLPQAPAPSTPRIAIAPIVEPEAEEDDEAETINPAYIIRRDPFLEIAPSASARVSASVMCSRTNRETRPAFCPEIDDEDVRFAMLARAQGDIGDYSPAGDTLFAQSTFNQVASPRNNLEKYGERYERVRQSLDEVASNTGSPIRRLGVGIERHAEGLQNCTPVRTGIARTGGVDGLSIELSNGSEVFCD